MNDGSVMLVERPYAEVVDDILTAVVGGVVNEPVYFDVKETLYKLSQPAADVSSVTGSVRQSVNGSSTLLRTTFAKNIDYLFSPSDNAVVWLGAAVPDDESTFYVDYTNPNSISPLTDINVGSVTRTLCEAIGREITTVYAQIKLAYLAGFVDTAAGQSLDLVVAILGVTRKTKEYAQGLVTFFRDPSVPAGSITIAQGTTLSSSAPGAPGFITAEPRTLQNGQSRIDVPVRADDRSKGPAGVVAAATITLLGAPIGGIARVSNSGPTLLGATDETDDDLRARAKTALQGAGKATIAALTQAVASERATLDQVRDPNSSPENATDPGKVLLLVDTPPERFLSVNSAVQDTRAAGVFAGLVARYVFFTPKLAVRLTSALSAAGKSKLVEQIIAAMHGYVDALPAGAPALGPALLGAITGSPDITATAAELANAENFRIVDVMAWRADIGGGATGILLDALVTAVQATPAGDAAALRAALGGVLTATAAPDFTQDRIPDRDLVVGPGNARATDAEIEAGTFSVVAAVGGDPTWTVALDIAPSDVALVSG